MPNRHPNLKMFKCNKTVWTTRLYSWDSPLTTFYSPRRCLIVYPWTQRYFGAFGNLYNADAIKSNPNIAAHGITVLHGLDRAVKNMDNIKATYAELSALHSEKLHVDPDNFKVIFHPLAPKNPLTCLPLTGSSWNVRILKNFTIFGIKQILSVYI